MAGWHELMTATGAEEEMIAFGGRFSSVFSTIIISLDFQVRLEPVGKAGVYVMFCLR